MHCIDDKPNGIILNHDGDWSGDVRIAWYLAEERRLAPGRLPPSLCECWCSGPDLVAGRFSPTHGPAHGLSTPEPPVNILTRAVALAVADYLHLKLGRAVDDIFNNIFIK